MRCALIADVHANLEALTAVLEELDRRGHDALLVAGDLAGYGPDPNACVRLLRDRGALAVAGNHDLMVLERMGLDRCVPDGRRAVRWTRRVLEPDLRLYLDSLPLARQLFPGVVLCHGSLDDADEYVATHRAARRQLQLLRERFPIAQLLVCGHTHRAAVHVEGLTLRPVPLSGLQTLPGHGPWMVNPGAVGQARDPDPLARCAVYDSDRRQVEFLALPYDVDACERKLFATGLTTCLYVRRPNPALRAARLARRAARRVLRRGS